MAAGYHWQRVIVLAILAVKFLDVHSYTVTTTSGTSGVTCSSGARCLGDGTATCSTGRCTCVAPFYKGLGFFLCVKLREVFCAIFNDPLILGYDGSTSHAPLNCKFKPTHLTTPICDASNPDNPVTYPENGSCDIRVRAWGLRRKGKSFLRGMDIRILVIYKGVMYHHVTRLISYASGGVYTFLESTNKAPFGSPTSGPAQNTSIPGAGDIYTTYDHVDNFARLVIEMCGVEIGIRGVDSELSPLETTSGIYIKVNEGCDPTYANPDSSLCSPPAGHGVSLAEHARWLSSLAGRPVSLAVALFHKVITGTTPQDFPQAAPALQELADTAQDCPLDKIVDAIEMCMFIMNEIKFLKCFDQTENLQNATALTSLCQFSVCDNNNMTCRDVQSMVAETGCQTRLPTTEGTLLERPCGEPENSTVLPS